jgi:hypothetical protein
MMPGGLGADDYGSIEITPVILIKILFQKEESYEKATQSFSPVIGKHHVDGHPVSLQ